LIETGLRVFGNLAGNSPGGEAVTKIGGDSIKPVTPAGLQETEAGAQPDPQGPGPSSARTVKVEITSVPAGLQHLDKVLNGVGVVDVASVESAKLAIIEGRFRVDSEVVARKLMATVREHLVLQQKR
jgi:flagellar biosynthesis anti-sigma factor FlgM